ncbi:MAG: hypothetical protein L6Q53_12450 [Candidatus Brocadia sinica]|nr:MULTISPECIES: hypothetical protein [Brocadia]MCK6468989.1 hypothetical protein [Candidatus Brocadia sinica]NOG41434.1 hypothetical protein [Planctomycetota bacterium]NUO04891.1 hypothetical protein [Candidatus Brocadia sinica]
MQIGIYRTDSGNRLQRTSTAMSRTLEMLGQDSARTITSLLDTKTSE